MFKRIFKIICLVCFISISSVSFSQDITEIDIVEGYSEPTFRELYSMMVMMGGLDINDPKVADEYGRMNYCHLYEELFSNDFEWNKARELIKKRVHDLADPYRVRYELVERLKIDRYDFRKGYFPIKRSSAMKNLGTMYIYNKRTFEDYCGLEKAPTSVFPTNIRMNLLNPLTVDRLIVSKANVSKVAKELDRIYDKGEDGRYFYARIRFTVNKSSGYIYTGSRKISGVIIDGIIDNIDFFYDEALAHKVEYVEGYN